MREDQRPSPVMLSTLTGPFENFCYTYFCRSATYSVWDWNVCGRAAVPFAPSTHALAFPFIFPVFKNWKVNWKVKSKWRQCTYSQKFEWRHKGSCLRQLRQKQTSLPRHYDYLKFSDFHFWFSHEWWIPQTPYRQSVLPRQSRLVWGNFHYLPAV